MARRCVKSFGTCDHAREAAGGEREGASEIRGWPGTGFERCAVERVPDTGGRLEAPAAPASAGSCGRWRDGAWPVSA
jgi:hypothetical protein